MNISGRMEDVNLIWELTLLYLFRNYNYETSRSKSSNVTVYKFGHVGTQENYRLYRQSS